MTDVPKPSASMAKAIERYFNVALYMLVLSGFGALASTGGLDLYSVTLVSVALSIRGYQLLRRIDFAIPERWTTILTLLYIIFYVVDYFVFSRGFLAASVHLVLFTMVVRLFSLQKTRDHYMLAVLSFLMVLAAAVLTVGSIFLISFAGFLLVAVITFVLMEMRHSVASEQTHALDPKVATPSRRMAYALMAIAPALMLMIMAGSFLIFFFLPRVSSRYLSAYTPTSDVSTGFTDRVQLGRIGQIQQSSTPVMHIEIQNDAQGAYDLKWRGIALSTFDGRTWSNSYEQTQLRPSSDGIYHLAPIPVPSMAAGRPIHYRVLMEPLGTNVYFLADRPRSLTAYSRSVSMDGGGAVFNLDSDHPITRYEGDSQVLQPDIDDLHQASNLSPPFMDRYLVLPPLDERIPKMAEDITAGRNSNYEKAVVLEQYLSTHFGYTLELPRTTLHDPLANFLFERKKGHCEYFASSMAVMLRSLRIPSRIVTGFRGGEFNDLTGQYVIRASDAHSWVEAYFPGTGWISFDPTPAGSAPTRSGWSRMQLYLDAASSFWREWIINYDSNHQRSLGKDAASNTRRFFDDARRWVGRKHRAMLRSARKAHRNISDFPTRWLGGLLLGLLILVLGFRLPRVVRMIRGWRVRAHPDRAPRESAALWYDRMVHRLARMGWRKSPSQTPLDFVAAIQERNLQQKVAKFTRAYESARFGKSDNDARSLPELYKNLTTTDTPDSEETERQAVS